MADLDPNYWFKKFFLKPFKHPFFWIAVFALAVYGVTLSYGLAWLDDNAIVETQFEFDHNLANIFEAFRQDITLTPGNPGPFYRPVERLTFMLDAQFGQNMILFMSHFTNILLHILAISLLYVFLLKLKIDCKKALFFSLVFAVHPITAQTVALISGRNDSLLAVFVFPALIYFLDYLETRHKKYLIGHLLFFALALFTKETAAILPIIMAVYIFLFTDWRKKLTEYQSFIYLLASWLGIGLVWFGARYFALHKFIGGSVLNLVSSLYYSLPSILSAIGKIMLPIKLSVYSVLKDMTMVYGIISIIILVIWFILSRRVNYRLLIFGITWLLLFIGPALINPFDKPMSFSENRIYIPMFGFIFMALGLGKPDFFNIFNERWQKVITYMAAIILIVTFSSITLYRNKYYQNGLNFWKNAVATSPHSATNHSFLGIVYFYDQNNPEMAEIEFKKALELNPREIPVHNNLGLIYLNRDQYELAEKEFNEELKFNKMSGEVYYNLGAVNFKTGDFDSAKKNWEEAYSMNQDDIKTLQRLTELAYLEKNYDVVILYTQELTKRGITIPSEVSQWLNSNN